MKKTLATLALGAFILLFGFGFLYSQSGEEAKFQKTLETYLDSYWKFYPTAATLAGFHKYDDKLEDLGGGSIDRHHEGLDAFNQELVAKVDRTKLGHDGQIDYDIVRNAIDLELIRHEALLPWEYSPLFYNEIFNNALRGLLTKDFAPLDARLKSATLRAGAVPGLVKQARENLKTPPQIYTEAAIAQLPGILAFYTSEAAGLAAPGSAEAKAKFQSELAKAAAAIQDYKTFLEAELLPRSTGNFRLGEQTHVRMLSMTSEFSIPPTELVARARADYNNIRREMAIVAMPFYRIMYPNINMEQISTQYSEEQLRNLFIKGVLDKIKIEHPAEKDFVAESQARVETIKAFLTQKQLAPLPDVPLAVQPTPPAEGGIALTGLVGPGAYETGGSYTAHVSPLPESLTDEQAASFLEGYNNYYLNFFVARNIYPGPFVPLFFTQKTPSVVRKLYPNMPLLKGWPSYVTELLVANGFGNYDLRLRLNQLKFQLKTVIDFLLELNIHEGSQTKEDAIKYMMNGGFQTEAEAEQNWNRILLKPFDAAYAYIGLQEIIDMQKDYRKLKGDAYTDKEFLQKLLSFGAMPIRYLKTSMAQ